MQDMINDAINTLKGKSSGLIYKVDSNFIESRACYRVTILLRPFGVNEDEGEDFVLSEVVGDSLEEVTSRAKEIAEITLKAVLSDLSRF